ncbi:hypothetical protein B0H14DRAFT_3143733 [Mycena olivaceomarginata]|nr:hypothetical protein B0H14DRAFT_3143733 [Mycena olivaceomarginata]
MLSNTADFALFDAAADFTTGEVVEYRRFMFPLLLGDSTHVPFFSFEDAPRWMTARGYALYQELNLAERLDPLRDHRYGSLRQLRAYREQVVGEAYVNHPFFQVDRAEDWVAPAPFNKWMRLMQELEAERGRKVNRSEAGSIRSYTPGSSVAASPPRSRTMSLAGRSDRLSCSPRSRSSSVHPNSRCSYGTGSGFSSRAASPSTILAFDLDIPSMIQPLHVESPPETTAIPQGTVTSKSSRRRGKGKGKQVEEDPDPRIKVTRELYVNRIIPVTTAPQTWTVPRDEVAYKLDVRANPDVLKNKKGNKMRTIDAYIKADLLGSQDQDAWDGSTGHAGPKGDVWVYAFSGERVRARRAQLRCKGICVCEFVSEELFGDCERFEPDEQAMRDLWNHKLDANEREAASPEAILSRFYTRVISSKCKTECDGLPVMILLNNVRALHAWPDAPIPASTDNSNDATISDATGNSRSDEPTSNMTLYLTNTDTQMGSHPGFELDPELEPNHECKSTFIWSLSTLHSPVSLVFNDNTLQTDNTDSGFGFNIGLASTTPTHSDSDLLQMITASATLPSVSVPGPAVLALATTPAARRRRRQSVDENDIVEGSRQRTQSKRVRGEA